MDAVGVRGRPFIKCKDSVGILEREEGQENERYGEWMLCV